MGGAATGADGAPADRDGSDDDGDATVDEWGEESFPASDPPAGWMGHGER